MNRKIILASHTKTLSGGAELSLCEIAIYLKKHGWEVLMTVPEEGPLSNHLKSIDIDYAIISYSWAASGVTEAPDVSENRASFNADSLGNIYDLFLSFDPDFVVTNTMTIPWFALVARTLGIPHAWFIREIPGRDGAVRLYPSNDEGIATIFADNDLIVFNSEFMKEYFTKHFTPAKTYDPARLTVCYPPINKSILKVPTTEVFSTPSISVILPGTISEHKNQLTVVRVVGDLVKQGVSIRLTLMGSVSSKSYFASITSYIKKHNLSEAITVAPFNPKPLEEIAKHDALIIPSINEPFGRVTLEGMLLGKVVIGADSGGTSELLQHHKTGLLFDPFNEKTLKQQILWLSKHQSEAKIIAHEARQWATKNFIDKDHLSVFAQQLEALAAKDNKEDRSLKVYTFNYALLYKNKALRMHTDNLETISRQQDNEIKRLQAIDALYSRYRKNFFIRVIAKIFRIR